MNLADVMDEVAARLGTIDGLRTFAYPPDRVTPPAAIVTYPTELNFDTAYARGMDRLTLPVIVLVGKVSDRTARNHIAAYVNGSGASSVKAVLESGTYTAFDTIRVTGAEFDVIQIAGVDHLAASLDLDITGPGGS